MDHHPSTEAAPPRHLLQAVVDRPVYDRPDWAAELRRMELLLLAGA